MCGAVGTPWRAPSLAAPVGACTSAVFQDCASPHFGPVGSVPIPSKPAKFRARSFASCLLAVACRSNPSMDSGEINVYDPPEVRTHLLELIGLMRAETRQSSRLACRRGAAWSPVRRGQSAWLAGEALLKQCFPGEWAGNRRVTACKYENGEFTSPGTSKEKVH